MLGLTVAAGEITNANWVSMGNGRGTNSNVNALAYDSSGNLYVGGDFTAVGAIKANGIARWDGEKWDALGAGVARVSSLVSDSLGNLYAAGDFTNVDGVAVAGVAKWDGKKWSVLSDIMSGKSPYITSLACDDSGNLYAGGDFTAIGGLAANDVAKWDGEKWLPLGVGLSESVAPPLIPPPEDYSYVTALACDSSGNLFAANCFTRGGDVGNLVYKWDGEHWSTLGAGNALIDTLACVFGNLFAGGNFTTIEGVAALHVAKWDGKSWTALGDGLISDACALTYDRAGNLYAGLDFADKGNCSGVAKWDGAKWSNLGDGMVSDYSMYVNALAFDSFGNLYAGGSFITTGDAAANNVAKWDGVNWSPLGEGDGLNASVGTLTRDASGKLYAGGNFTAIGALACKHVAQWDGVKWSALNDGMDKDVYALAHDNSGNLYAGGKFTTAGGVSASYIAKWNGENWSALGEGMNDYVYGLACDNSGNLYAGGIFTTAGGVSASYIAKWNGENWSALGDGASTYIATLVCDSSGDLYAGGLFPATGSATAKRIAKWDGSKWSTLGDMTSDAVATFAFDSAGTLYAYGSYIATKKVTAGRITKWDGMKWSMVCEGVTGDYLTSVANLAFDSADKLYVGGRFTAAGGVAANNVAKWDGKKWSTLGDGISGNYASYVGSLAIASGNLYVGGDFTTAGDKSSWFIAKCQLPAQTYTVTFLAGVDGKIDGDSRQVVNHGADCSAVNATPAPGHHFVNWRGDCSGTENPLTVRNVTKDMTITANFAVDTVTHTVTFLAGVGGAVIGDAKQTVNHGADCSAVNAAPALGHDFYNWIGADTETSENPLTVRNVTKDMTFTANFVAQQVFHVAPGSTFTYKPATAYLKKPKVAIGKYRAKVLNKNSEFKDGGVKELRCQWTSVKAKPDTYTLTLGAESTPYFIIEQPVLDAVSSDAAVADAKITVSGKYFGVARPNKVCLRYVNPCTNKAKNFNCKLDKPLYDDANGKKGKSYMKVNQEAQGESTLGFTVPKKITADMAVTLHLVFRFADLTYDFNKK